RARTHRRPCRFGYLKPGADAPELRRLHSYALVHAEGAWYAAGRDPDAGEPRVFRVDRILAVEADGPADAYEVPQDFDPEQLLDGSRLFHLPAPDAAPSVEVRYRAPVVPWVREQWQGEPDADGGYRVRHPVGDPAWVVRHVLQYGPDAEVVGPPEMRRAVRAAATRLAEAEGGGVG
ncbi:MAG: WYL domain-containing protein, partial [Gemmatimonadota bacterium]